MIYYIEFYEVSSVTGGSFPQYGFKKISFSEAIEIMDVRVNMSSSHREMPWEITPKIITNDTYLSMTFRQVYSFMEFKKWCGLKLESKDDRKYFTNSNFHEYDTLGEEIFNEFLKLINGDYYFIMMNKGLETIEAYDGENNTYYSDSPYDRGWIKQDYSTLQTENLELIKQEEEAPALYTWWNSLDKTWQKLFFGKTASYENYIPSIPMGSVI